MNKKIFTIAVMLLISINVLAQDAQPQDSLPSNTVVEDTIWRVNGAFGLNLNQVSLTNWIGGGESSIAYGATFDFTANYLKGKWKWDNLLRLAYGNQKIGEGNWNKTDDQILINTNLAYQLKGAWYIGLNVNFRTQFFDGFILPNDSVKVSTLMAPGYLVPAIGIEYKPNDNFNFFFSPLSNKTIFVMDDFLSAQGAYGVDTLARSNTELGIFISFFYKKEIVKNVTLTTLYTMFGDYEKLQSWDINWDLILDFKINSFLAANITTNLIYDDDIAIPVDRTGDGIKESFGPRVQFRQALGIGLTAKF